MIEERVYEEAALTRKLDWLEIGSLQHFGLSENRINPDKPIWFCCWMILFWPAVVLQSWWTVVLQRWWTTRIPSSLWCNPFQPLPWSSISAAAVESCWNVGSSASKRGHTATGPGVLVIQGVHWSWCRTYWDSVAPRTLGTHWERWVRRSWPNKALHFFDRRLGFPPGSTQSDDRHFSKAFCHIW